MVFGKVSAVYCGSDNKYINIKCAQNSVFLNIKVRNKISYKCYLNS
jgi:hypothetical protein